MVNLEKLVKENCAALGARKKQVEAVQKIVDCFVNGYSKEFLLSACCRFGKTTTAYITVDTLAKALEQEDYILLIVTALPGSVTDSWKDDAERLFGAKVENIDDMDMSVLSGKHIVIVSTQKAGKNKDKKTKEAKEHKNVNEFISYYNNHKGLKVTAKDEAHVAGSTDRTLEFLNQLNEDFALDITATPFCEELITKYHLDTVEGDKCSYSCTQLDMLKFYEASNGAGTLREDGFIGKDNKVWVPVKPRFLIENLAEKALEHGLIFIDDEDDPSASLVTAYIKTIFGNVEEYRQYCDEFIDTYIVDFAKKYGKNMIGFTSTNNIGALIAEYIDRNEKYRDIIDTLPLAEKVSKEDENLSESAVKRANDFLAKSDDKIHLILTCRKCGTGSTLHNLNTVLFLKGVSNYKEFMQYAARAFNPDEGKEYGNVVMFNPESCLQMLRYAGGSLATAYDGENAKPIEEVLKFYEIYLDGERLVDATQVISNLDNIFNGNTVLFPSLNECLFTDADFFNQIAEEVKAKAGVSKKKDSGEDPDKRKPSNPKDDGDDNNQADQQAAKKKDRKEITKESLAKAFQNAFVDLIKGLATKYSEDEIINNAFLNDDNGYLNKMTVTLGLCGIDLWNLLVENYLPKVLHKVYVYVTKVNKIEDAKNA